MKSIFFCQFSHFTVVFSPLDFAFTPTRLVVKMINNFYLLLQCFFGSSCFRNFSLINFHLFLWFTESDFRRRWRKITLRDGWDFFNETSHQMLSGAINSFTWYIRYFSFLLFLLILFFTFFRGRFFGANSLTFFIARVFYSTKYFSRLVDETSFLTHKTFIEIYFSAVFLQRFYDASCEIRKCNLFFFTFN